MQSLPAAQFQFAALFDNGGVHGITKGHSFYVIAGTESEKDRQPDSMPDRLETGNHNMLGILGLAAGIEFVEQRGLEYARKHDLEMAHRLVDGLSNIPGVIVLGPADSDRRVSVVSIRMSGYDPQEVAAMLDTAFGIQVRSGLHCAPRIHEALGTIPHGGAIRFSPGPFNTLADIELAIEAVAQLATT